MDSNNPAISKLQRNSNIELFRIVATLLVLIVHFNGWFVGGLPDSYSFDSLTVHDGVQLYIQGLSCCCVNSFLIISGWFGVKLKFRSIWKLWLVLISVYVPCFIVECVLDKRFELWKLIDSFIAFSRESYYIQNYLILVFISPVLNAFIEKYGQKITPFALTFWGIEFVMEFLLDNKCLYIEHGYSLIHFVLMYFLARTAYLNRDRLYKIDKKIYLSAYFVFALMIAIYGFVAKDGSFATAYSCPLVIIESFCLFLFFAQLNFSNKAVNYVASATLTVYVLQVTYPVILWLMKADSYLLRHFNYGLYLLLALSVIIVFFALATLYGKVMDRVLNLIFSPLGNYLEKKTSNFFIY